MASSDAVKKIVAKIHSLECQVVKLESDIKACDPLVVTLQELSIAAKKIAKNEETLDKLRNELYEHITDPAEVKTNEVQLSLIDKLITSVQIMILTLQSPIAPVTTTTTANPIRPPPLQLPTFSGKFEDWPVFHDKFKAQIHSRTDIFGSSKLAYLQTCLKGEAAALVSAYEQTDANYIEAWNELNAIYDVKRQIVFSVVSLFLDFKPCYSDPTEGLQSIANAMKKVYLALKLQSITPNDRDPFIVVSGIRKLDPKSREQWAMHFKGDLPTIDEFSEFLVLRARSLTPACSISTTQAQVKPKNDKGKSSHHVSKPNQRPWKNPCVKCKGEHTLSWCPDFTKLSIREKCNFAKQKNVCSNCLRSDHNVEDCQKKATCNKCGKKHHNLLHRETTPEAAPVNINHCAKSSPSEKVILLGTLLVNVTDARGGTQQCRVFVDNGSESHFVSEHCLNRLGLKRKKVSIPLNGIGHEPGPVSKGQVQLKIHSRTEPYSLDINALVLSKFAGLIPATKCRSEWNHFEDITLSDPKYHSLHYTDILLGAAKSGHIMIPGIKTHPTNPEAPVALNTRFGWMVNGESPAVRKTKSHRSIHHAAIQSSDQNLDEIMVKFWEQEEPETHPQPKSSSDVECESHFLSTQSENEDGTYTVHLPFRPDAKPLGKSRDAAVRRFLNVEKRLSSQPEIKKEYVKSIREYLHLDTWNRFHWKNSGSLLTCLITCPTRKWSRSPVLLQRFE